jgi:hypothetical protein
MRNEPKPLTRTQLADVLARTKTLAGAFNDDQSVTLVYVKRDGTTSSSTGKIDGFIGNAMMDTFSVNIVDTAKGIRTVNVVRIKSIIF